MPRITHRRKKHYFPILVERDGYLCFYCGKIFTDDHPAEWDHLNNNCNDTRPENLVFAHHECNNKKKTNAEWQVKAHDKLLQNERAVLTCERRLADTGSTEQLTSSQSINKALRPHAQQWLEEHLILERQIILKDAVNAIVSLCQKLTGWGSQATIYRYIDEWANPYNGKFTLSKNEAGQTVIRRRTEN